MQPLLSGYTTSWQALARDYPLLECVQALLGFCDEVVVVDAGSTDGTWQALVELRSVQPRLRLLQEPVDFAQPRWALALDGGLKARARALCQGRFCWQADLDEIPADDAGGKIRRLAQELSPEVLVVAVPFVDYWGDVTAVRADIDAAFPRLSRNLAYVTHGVPRPSRRFDRRGELYAAPYESDSCNYIDARTLDPLPIRSLLPAGLAALRQVDLEQYQLGFNRLLEVAPCVFHVSWLAIERKLRHYREHWPAFHASLFDKPEDAVTSPLLGKPWAEASDEELLQLAERLRREGPRILHGVRPAGPVIRCGKLPPVALEPWILRNLETEGALP
jgi:hypothetical protein